MWTCGECRMTDGDVFYPCQHCKRGRFHKKCTAFVEGEREENGLVRKGNILVCRKCAAELIIGFGYRQV